MYSTKSSMIQRSSMTNTSFTICSPYRNQTYLFAYVSLRFLLFIGYLVMIRYFGEGGNKLYSITIGKRNRLHRDDLVHKSPIALPAISAIFSRSHACENKLWGCIGVGIFC